MKEDITLGEAMEKYPKTTSRIKTTIIIIVSVWLGSLLFGGEQVTDTKTVVEYRTPEACRQVIELDSASYTRFGEFFGNLSQATNGTTDMFFVAISRESQAMTAYLEPKIEQRRQLIDECLNK